LARALQCAAIVRPTRTTPAAFLLAAAIFAVTATPMFAIREHVVCVGQRHDCGTTAKIRSCCCGDQGDPTGQGGPVEARVQPGGKPTLATAILITAVLHAPRATSEHLQTSPARDGPPNLTTQFSALLI
jgi:hypothetical protein